MWMVFVQQEVDTYESSAVSSGKALEGCLIGLTVRCSLCHLQGCPHNSIFES